MASVHICTICFEEYRDPKIIPCFHTFCRDCLGSHVERVLRDGKFNCPVCRAVIKTPENGVDGFQSNFYINELTKSMTLQGKSKEKEAVKLCEEDLKSGNCLEHLTEKLTLYCEMCKVPCCRDCKIELHDGHNSVKLIEMSKRLSKEANKILRAIEKKTERMMKQEIDLNAKLETLQSEKTRILGEFRTRKAAIDEKVQNESKLAVQHLANITKTTNDVIVDSLVKVKATKDELVKISFLLTQTMESNDPLKLLQAIPELREKTESITARINVESLFPGIVIQKSDIPSDSQVKLAIGKLFLKKYQKVIKCYLENVTIIDMNMKDRGLLVKTILPMSETEAWIALRSRRKSNRYTLMTNFNSNGDVLLSFRLNNLVNSMTRLSNGKIAITMPVDNMICIMEGENVYEFAGVRNPMGIASYEDDVFVCSVESVELEETKEMKPYSVNRVLVFSLEGLLKRTVEFYEGNALFAFPGKLSVNYNGDLYVSDFSRNKVVCVGPDGRLKYQYNGDKDFVCGDVFCDNAGHIIVDTSEGVHVLDENLKLIHRFTTEFSAEHTVAIAIGSNGIMWVADSECKVTMFRYFE